MNSAAATIVEVAGESLVLHPAKVAWWIRKSTLLLADSHFGKAATFRQAGLVVPPGTTARMLQRLSDLVQECKAERIIVLGDFVHSSARAESDFESELIAWRNQHRNLCLTLIRGNHDRGHAELFSAMRFEVLCEPHVEEAIAFCHRPDLAVGAGLYGIAGHIHPSLWIEDAGRAGVKLPCFIVGLRQMVLPAFGEFTGSATMPVKPGVRMFAVAGDQVIEVTPRGRSGRT